MLIDVLTLFPGMFDPILGESIIGRAQEKGLIKIGIHDLRQFTDDPHNKVDSPGFGGGPGMVLRCQPVFKALETILNGQVLAKNRTKTKKKVVFFTPQGKILTQQTVKEFVNCEQLVLLTGRYEGIDQRIRDNCVDYEISVGDYILSGGELASMVFIDSLARLIPGVVSCKDSIEQESFENGLLDYPHYTKPRDFQGFKVPDILVSGDHERIEKWRKEQAIERTKALRPDLFEKYKEKKEK